MDSVPLEMDDIFAEYENDDDGFNPSALPDLADELEPMRDMMQDNNEEDGGGDGEVSAELLAQLKNMKGASKNNPKRTIPKLDATRLTGDRGIAVLPMVFDKVPLKGKNHEAEDLKLIMHKMQHWGHRLFPKMTFDEVLERVERLGKQKAVQTCLKRIRLDMPVLEGDFVGNDEDNVHRAGDEEDNVHRAGDNMEGGDNPNDVSRTSQQEAMDHSHDEISDSELNDLLREQQQPVNAVSQSQTKSITQVNVPSQSESNASPTSSAGKTSGLSDEMRKKIEENKRKAMERRAAKLAGNTSLCSNSTDLNSSVATTVDNSQPGVISQQNPLALDQTNKPEASEEINPSFDKTVDESNLECDNTINQSVNKETVTNPSFDTTVRDETSSECDNTINQSVNKETMTNHKLSPSVGVGNKSIVEGNDQNEGTGPFDVHKEFIEFTPSTEPMECDLEEQSGNDIVTSHEYSKQIDEALSSEILSDNVTADDVNVEDHTHTTT